MHCLTDDASPEFARYHASFITTATCTGYSCAFWDSYFIQTDFNKALFNLLCCFVALFLFFASLALLVALFPKRRTETQLT